MNAHPVSVSSVLDLTRVGRLSPEMGALLLDLRQRIAWRRRPWWHRALIVACCFLAALTACGPTRRERCLRNAGRWVAVHCHEEDSPICSTVDYGNGMAITTCIPMTSTVCDYECHGAAAEDVGP